MTTILHAVATLCAGLCFAGLAMLAAYGLYRVAMHYLLRDK